MINFKSKLLDEILNQSEVEWYKLHEISHFHNGLTGKNKASFENGNAKYISYKSIFNNIAITDEQSDQFELVDVAPTEKQQDLKYGDVLFTASSETALEIGMSSVITVNFTEKIYLNSFSFAVRFKKEIEVLPEFSKYLFRSNFIRSQIIKTGNGVTRINISKARFKDIEVPIPSLSTQQKIVDILDTFTTLTAELTAELTARKQQYEYYRDELLTFGDDVEWRELGELLSEKGYIRGPFGSALKKSFFVEIGVPVYEQRHAIHDNRDFRYFITEEKAETLSRFKIKPNDLIISCSGTIGKISVIKQSDKTGVINQALLILRLDTSQILIWYLKYYLECYPDLIVSNSGGAITNIERRAVIEKIKIPIPSLDEQAWIVEILDKFDALTHSITEGLPREIELRQQQYEYYRDLLLSFPKPDEVK